MVRRQTAAALGRWDGGYSLAAAGGRWGLLRQLAAAASAKDPWTVLGVGRSASEQEIKRRYFELAKKYHPDLNPNDASASLRFREISDAYRILKDPVKRRAYESSSSEREYQQWQQGYANRHHGGGQHRSTQQQEDDPFEMFRQVYNDFGVDEYREYARVMQKDLEVSLSAAWRGDYSPAWDFVGRYRSVIVGVLLPLALVLRFPGLIVGALRMGALVGAYMMRDRYVRQVVLNWLWRVLVRQARRR